MKRIVKEKEFIGVLNATNEKRLKYCIDNLTIYGCYAYIDKSNKVVEVMPFQEYTKNSTKQYTHYTYLSFLHDICVNPECRGFAVSALPVNGESKAISLREFYLQILEERSRW